MKVTIDIERATVFEGEFSDICAFDLAEPVEAVWPFKNPLHLQFDSVKGEGAKYIKKHFGIEAKIIKMRN